MPTPSPNKIQKEKIKMTEYIIVGEGTYGECLICCAGYTKEQAEKTLNEVMTGNEWYNQEHRANHKNIHIKEIKKESAWWNDSTMVK